MDRERNKLMKNFLIVLLLSCILFGCVTKRRCQNKFPPETITIYKDSIIYTEKVVIKDSIITVKLPKDTVFINKYITIDSNGEINVDTIIVEKGIVGAKAWITHNQLGVVAYVSDSTIFYQLKEAKIIIEKQEKQISSKIEKTIETKWYVPKIFWWLIGLAFVGGIVVQKKWLSKIF